MRYRLADGLLGLHSHAQNKEWADKVRRIDRVLIILYNISIIPACSITEVGAR